MNLSDRVIAEESTSGGISDIVIRFSPSLIYIFELKVGSISDKALSQIKEKKYYQKYLNSKSKIHLVGLNFSKTTRIIENYSEEILAI